MKGGNILSSELSSHIRKIIVRYHTVWSRLDAAAENTSFDSSRTTLTVTDCGDAAPLPMLPQSVTKRSGIRLMSPSSRRYLSMISSNDASPSMALLEDHGSNKGDNEDEFTSLDNGGALSVDNGAGSSARMSDVFGDVCGRLASVNITSSSPAALSPINESAGIISYEYKKPVTSFRSLEESPYCLPVSHPERVERRAKTPSAEPRARKFTAQRRDALVNGLFATYNSMAFMNKLPADLKVTWSKRLLTTAGITKSSYDRGARVSSIELSLKVVVDERRLESTLLHELCHAASWVIDGERKPPHGGCFWKWAKSAEQRIPGAQVTTCHSYDIHKAHRFKCLSPGCDMVYSRHSKKGIDVGRHRCGQCQGRLEYVGAFNIDGSRKKEREANGFSLFVKENFDAVKIQMSAVKSKKCVINLDDSRDKNIDLTYSGYSSSGSTDSRGRAKKSSSKKTLKSATPKMTDVMKKLGLMYKEMNVGGQTAAAEEIV